MERNDFFGFFFFWFTGPKRSRSRSLWAIIRWIRTPNRWRPSKSGWRRFSSIPTLNSRRRPIATTWPSCDWTATCRMSRTFRPFVFRRRIKISSANTPGPPDGEPWQPVSFSPLLLLLTTAFITINYYLILLIWLLLLLNTTTFTTT